MFIPIYNSNAVSDTAFKVVNGLINSTEDVTLEGYNEYGDVYTFAGQHLLKSHV